MALGSDAETKRGDRNVDLSTKSALPAWSRQHHCTTPTGQVEQIHYVGTSNNPAYLTDGSNNVVARWTYGPNGLPALMAVNVSGSWDTYEYVYKGLNDVIGLIDLTIGSSTYGQMVVQYQYDAYGNPLTTTDTSGVTVMGQGLAAFNSFQYRRRRTRSG